MQWTVMSRKSLRIFNLGFWTESWLMLEQKIILQHSRERSRNETKRDLWLNSTWIQRSEWHLSAAMIIHFLDIILSYAPLTFWLLKVGKMMLTKRICKAELFLYHQTEWRAIPVLAWVKWTAISVSMWGEVDSDSWVDSNSVVRSTIPVLVGLKWTAIPGLARTT